MIRDVIEQVDSIISEDEEALIRLSNERYESALKASIKEFKTLIKLGPVVKVGSDEVQEIIKKAADAFDAEFEKLTEPIQRAMLKAYDLGLKETGKIIEESELESNLSKAQVRVKPTFGRRGHKIVPIKGYVQERQSNHGTDRPLEKLDFAQVEPSRKDLRYVVKIKPSETIEQDFRIQNNNPAR